MAAGVHGLFVGKAMSIWGIHPSRYYLSLFFFVVVHVVHRPIVVRSLTLLLSLASFVFRVLLGVCVASNYFFLLFLRKVGVAHVGRSN